MDDLISRQAAIEAVLDRIDVEKHGRNAKPEEIQWTLEKLPSAQPERLTDDDFETIRIHLNAYKEKLCNQQRWEEADEYQRIIDRFMAFASAQTENEERKEESAQNVPKEDLISRKAAIDALIRKIRPHNNGDGTITMCVISEELVRKTLNDLPSAQPERKTGRWIPVMNGRGGHCCNRCNGYAPSYMNGDEHLSDFCPYCGAYMGGDADGDMPD